MSKDMITKVMSLVSTWIAYFPRTLSQYLWVYIATAIEYGLLTNMRAKMQRNTSLGEKEECILRSWKKLSSCVKKSQHQRRHITGLLEDTTFICHIV